MRNIVKINIKERDDYISKFNEDALSNKLSNYILEECRGYKLRSHIVIEISSGYEMEEEEKKKITSMIRNNFQAETKEVLVSQKMNYIIDFILLIVGIVGLVLYYFLLRNIPIVSDVALIFCWVIIWECIYNLIFITFRNLIDIERKKKLATCKIVFK